VTKYVSGYQAIRIPMEVYIWYMICYSRGEYILDMLTCFLDVSTEATLVATVYGI
jgi:hypothetical protein